MSLQLKSRRVGNINRKILTLVAVFAVVLQPLAPAYSASAQSTTYKDGAFTLRVTCSDDERVVLNLQAKQEVKNWLLGNVFYTTRYGSELHSLSNGDTDRWEVKTDRTQVPAGTATAFIYGSYLFGVYAKTFTVNYAAINCDATAPTGEITYASASLTNQDVTATLTTNEPVTVPGWSKVTDREFTKQYPANTKESVTFEDYAGNEAQLLVDITWIDKVAPTVTLKDSPDTIGTNPYSKVSFKLFDQNKVDKAEVNGTLISLNDSEWSDLNHITSKSMGGREGLNTLNVYDVAGNVTTVEFVLDDTAPTATFTYSNKNGDQVTGEDVVVTMKTAESITVPEGWVAVEGRTDMFTTTHDRNGKFKLSIYDLAGNKANVSYEVKRIDKVAPTIGGAVDGEMYTGPVALAVTDQNLQAIRINGVTAPFEKVSGWTYKLASPILLDGDYTVEASDKAGNITVMTFVIKAPVINATMPGATLAPTALIGAGMNQQRMIAPLRTVAFTAANTTTNDGTTETAVEAASNESLVPGKDTLASAMTSDVTAASDVSDKDNNWSVWPLIAIVVAIGAVWGAIATVRRKPTDA